MRDYVSYSQFKIWSECAWRYKLQYVDNIKKFGGNEYTAFGTAIHDVCEKTAKEELSGPAHAKLLFSTRFKKELDSLPEDYELNNKLLEQMKEQGEELLPEIFPALKEYFGEYEVISAEEQIYTPIKEYSGSEHKFKGFIDLVVKTSDDKYHIIDWKTCSWGWDARKKSNKLIVYQLIFYKHYYALKHGIDPNNIETHFALLKRTAKKNKVEIFRNTSGKKRTENALKALKNSLYYIDKKFYIKNRLSCRYCEFKKTEHCR
jgi:ATP-dependent exoDNAse (exonuclease V) beta subunit